MIFWSLAIAAAAGFLLGLRFQVFAVIGTSVLLVLATSALAFWQAMSVWGGLGFVLLALVVFEGGYLVGALVSMRR